MLKCLIIDDEPIARDGMADYVKDISFLNLVATCEDALEALHWLESEIIDLIFLDIQMPKLNGLDLLKAMDQKPMVIITTAFPSFALEGFQLEVLDYLVKPFSFQRFLKASNKAKKQFALIKQTETKASTDDYFFVKCETSFEKIRLNEILFAHAMQNYVQIYTLRGKFTTLISMKKLLAELPEKKFMQVHKSYIVALDKIDSLHGNQIRIAEQNIPISRSNKEQLLEQLLTGKLLRK